MAGLIPLGQLEVAADLTTAALLSSPVQTATQSAVQTLISDHTDPIVDGLVADALAADPTPATAAAAAVASAMAANSLAYTLVYGPLPTPSPMTVAFGTPVFGTPAKFGTAAMSGATLNVGTPIPQPTTVPVTVEGWVYMTAPQSAIKVVASLGSTLYVAVEPTTGHLSLTLSGVAGSKVISSVNVANGAWHHFAFEVTQPAGIITEWKLWVDGAVVTGSPTITALAWPTAFTVSGFSSTSTYLFPGSVDDMRVSDVSRYSGAFTPPTAAATLDSSTVALADMDSIDYTRLTSKYPSRPAGAPAGAVTYIGSVQPSDWLTNDRWVQV